MRGGFDMTKVIASRDCSNAAGTRAQKVGDHGLVWRSFVHGMLLTNGGVLDKFTCQVIPGVVHAWPIMNLPFLDKELFCGKVFNLV